MKEIFKSLIGMTFITGIYLVFNFLIDFHAPDLLPMISFARGFLFVTLAMGSVLILKQVFQFLRDCCFHR